jgi:predicted GIY-YIG superfamily endonuclease
VKTHFVDQRNFFHLLPASGNSLLISRLEHCLQEINRKCGVIDQLIQQNQNTVNKSVGTERLVSLSFDIAQAIAADNGGILTQAVIKPPNAPPFYHCILGYQNGVAHKLIIPLQFLLKGWGDANIGHQCYIHTISGNIPRRVTSSELQSLNMRKSDNYYYVGITSRNWMMRLNEHVREMASGSQRRFYKAWRDHYGTPGVLFTSTLRNLNLSYEAAMNWEEAMVEDIASDKYGLNMIPGGFKGLKLLHSCRLIQNETITLDERDVAIANYVHLNPRKGLPNPFISELWKDDDFYVKVIEAKEKTLRVEQVRKIRELNAQGMAVSDITKAVSAINDQQVKGVLNGKSYTRVR